MKIYQKRNSTIELLRIISMLMIVFHHFAIHGDFSFDESQFTIPRLWYNFINMGGRIGVDIFILISGYYLINNTEIKINFKRLLKFWMQVFFYSILITVVFKIFNIGDIGIKEILKSFLPITFCKWWFASAYFFLYIFHPYLNKLLRSLTKEEFKHLLIVMAICWSFIPTFLRSNHNGNQFIWLVCLYCFAAYINLYGFSVKYNQMTYILGWVMFSLVTYSCSTLIMLLGTKWNAFVPYIDMFYDKEQIPIVCISICIFMVFINMKPINSRIINCIASATFGVYLIHDNEFVQKFLWVEVFHNARYQQSIYLVPYSVIVSLLVFIFCTLIDLLRQNIFEPIFVKMLDRYIE